MVSEEVRKEIAEGHKTFSKGFKKGDASIIASVYAEDAVILPPDTGMIRGRKAIEEFWKGVIGSGVKEAVLNAVEQIGSGDFIQEMGTVILKAETEEGGLVERKAKYVVVLKKTIDGWKLLWDIWNSLP